MKLLFDHNLSPSLPKRLADLYPSSGHVHSLGLGRALDTEVWNHAEREGFSVVTKDADFSDLCTLRGFPPNVIWVRRGNCKTAEVEALLRNHADVITAFIADQRVGVLALF